MQKYVQFPSYRVGDAAYSNLPTKSRIQACSLRFMGLRDFGRDNLPYQLCNQGALSRPKLLVSWEWNHFRWLIFYFWTVSVHYITVDLSTAQLLHNYYLYYTIFSKQCKEGSLNVLYFFPPEICTGYQNISYVSWIRETKTTHLVHSQYDCQMPKTCFHIWNKCFASIQEASECGIKLDAIISNSCFFLMMNMVTCIKDPLKGRILSLILQADTVEMWMRTPSLLCFCGQTP